jgi:hypothetical protein
LYPEQRLIDQLEQSFRLGRKVSRALGGTLLSSGQNSFGRTTGPVQSGRICRIGKMRWIFPLCLWGNVKAHCDVKVQIPAYPFITQCLLLLISSFCSLYSPFTAELPLHNRTYHCHKLYSSAKSECEADANCICHRDDSTSACCGA